MEIRGRTLGAKQRAESLIMEVYFLTYLLSCGAAGPFSDRFGEQGLILGDEKTRRDPGGEEW